MMLKRRWPVKQIARVRDVTNRANAKLKGTAPSRAAAKRELRWGARVRAVRSSNAGKPRIVRIGRPAMVRGESAVEAMIAPRGLRCF